MDFLSRFGKQVQGRTTNQDVTKGVLKKSKGKESIARTQNEPILKAGGDFLNVKCCVAD